MLVIDGREDFWPVRLSGWTIQKDFLSRDDARIHADKVRRNLALGDEPVMVLLNSRTTDNIEFKASDFNVRFRVPANYRLHKRMERSDPGTSGKVPPVDSSARAASPRVYRSLSKK